MSRATEFWPSASSISDIRAPTDVSSPGPMFSSALLAWAVSPSLRLILAETMRRVSSSAASASIPTMSRLSPSGKSISVYICDWTSLAASLRRLDRNRW
ncbi:MAG: hypothetical protein Q4Q62_04845 [Thermoplasmata archaeon]|nr:hypothetical protein [Thermoplasmata archaeon]